MLYIHITLLNIDLNCIHYLVSKKKYVKISLNENEIFVIE